MRLGILWTLGSRLALALSLSVGLAQAEPLELPLAGTYLVGTHLFQIGPDAPVRVGGIRPLGLQAELQSQGGMICGGGDLQVEARLQLRASPSSETGWTSPWVRVETSRGEYFLSFTPPPQSGGLADPFYLQLEIRTIVGAGCIAEMPRLEVGFALLAVDRASVSISTSSWGGVKVLETSGLPEP